MMNQPLRNSDSSDRALSARLRLLLEKTSHLIETLEPQEQLRSLMDLSGQVVVADAFGVWRRHDDGTWTIVSSQGLSEAFLQETLQGGKSGDLPTEPLVVQPDDLANRTTPLLRDRWERYDREGIRSLMILPLRIRGEVSGTLVFYCRSPHRFTEIEIAAARALANVAAAAITTSELYESQSLLRKRAEEAAVREAFLASAGAILAESLDYEQTLANVARAAVPQFADWCAVDLLDDGGQLRRLAVAHIDPQKIALAMELHEKYSRQNRPDAGAWRVIRTGEPEMLREIPALLLESAAVDEDHLQLLRDLELTSYVCVPLRARGALLGAITFVTAESKRSFEKHDLVLAQEIARRAEQAINNSRLYKSHLESKQRLQAVLDVLPLPIFIADASGELLATNPAANELWGTAPLSQRPENYGDDYKAWWADSGKKVEAHEWGMSRALSNGEIVSAEEVDVEARNGRRFTILNYARPIRTPDGQITGGVALNVDITERKKAEEELRRLNAELQEADRRKDEFLATLAHELRNPLAPIRNAAQLLRLAKGDAALAEQALDILDRQIGQMVRLVDDLMDVGRITRGKIQLRKQRVALADVLASALETTRLIIEASGHKLTVEMPPEPIYVEADPTRFAQIVSNLLSNAAKYTHRGGRIWLSVRRTREEAVVSVRDTGIGISAENLPHVFDIFTQVTTALDRAQGGLGIGLSLVQELIELHGGAVEAHSDGAGKGSEFVVRMPVCDAVAAPASDQPSSDGRPQGRCSPCRVIVADDNRDNVTSLASMLRFDGHEVQTAHNGLDAVQATQAFRPHIVLLDIGMPQMNGYEAAQHIRQQAGGDGITLVAMTGWGQEEDKRRASEAGFDHHLTKPVDPKALEAVLVRASAQASRS